MDPMFIGGYSVLVVEDKYLIGASLSQALERLGAKVTGPIDNVKDALAVLNSSIDIAILDVKLGAEASFPIADQLVRLGIPFIFATGTPRAIPIEHKSRIVCGKPYTVTTIMAALEVALFGVTARK